MKYLGFFDHYERYFYGKLKISLKKIQVFFLFPPIKEELILYN